MRYYVSGNIELSKEIPEEVIQDEKGYSCGDIFFNTYELDFNEYFVDELENEINALCDYAKENDVYLKGSLVVDDCDGEKGEYVFDGTDYEEFWGDAYYIRYMPDNFIIEELKKRGYEVIKKGA